MSTGLGSAVTAVSLVLVLDHSMCFLIFRVVCLYQSYRILALKSLFSANIIYDGIKAQSTWTIETNIALTTRSPFTS